MLPATIFQREPAKDFEGKIVNISELFRTSYTLDDGSTHYGGRLLKGLSVQDSVHSYANSGGEEYFKKDSSGVYREILWTQINSESSIYEWHFKK